MSYVNSKIKISKKVSIRIINLGNRKLIPNSYLFFDIISYIDIIVDLLISKHMNIKPNYSELARMYNLDWHTVAKYFTVLTIT